MNETVKTFPPTGINSMRDWIRFFEEDLRNCLKVNMADAHEVKTLGLTFVYNVETNEWEVYIKVKKLLGEE